MNNETRAGGFVCTNTTADLGNENVDAETQNAWHYILNNASRRITTYNRSKTLISKSQARTHKDLKSYKTFEELHK